MFRLDKHSNGIFLPFSKRQKLFFYEQSLGHFSRIFHSKLNISKRNKIAYLKNLRIIKAHWVYGEKL